MNSYKFNIPANSAPIPPKGVRLAFPTSLNTPSAAKPADGLPFNRGARSPFKQTVALPGQLSGQQPGAVPSNSSTSGVSVSASLHASTPAPISASGSTKPKPSLEHEYFLHKTKSGKYAREDGVLFRWNGIYWVAQDLEEAVQDAATWLSQTHADRATTHTAKSCMEWLICNAANLPKADSKRCIIPLRNAYLEVMGNSKQIQAIKPDPLLGQTFCLGISVPFVTGQFTPSAVPPGSLFRKFLDSSIPNADDQAFLQELFGYTLTASTAHQVAIVLKGGGRNGKSVFIRLLRALHGKVASLRLDRLHGFNLMTLVGASLAVVEEMPAGNVDEQTLKAMVSGEGLPIDRKYLNPITYHPTAKLIISTNNDLRARDNSDGLWRRFAIIHFDHQVPQGQVIPNLADKIIEQELSVFLDWCLSGLLRLTQRGHLPDPTPSMKAAKTYAILASDPVAAWIHDHEVTVDPAARTSKAHAYDRYCDWSRINHRRVMDSGAFWKAMAARLPSMVTFQARDAGQRHYYATLVFGEPTLPSSPTEGTPFDGDA